MKQCFSQQENSECYFHKMLSCYALSLQFEKTMFSFQVMVCEERLTLNMASGSRLVVPTTTNNRFFCGVTFCEQKDSLSSEMVLSSRRRKRRNMTTASYRMLRHCCLSLPQHFQNLSGFVVFPQASSGFPRKQSYYYHLVCCKWSSYPLLFFFISY